MAVDDVEDEGRLDVLGKNEDNADRELPTTGITVGVLPPFTWTG